MKKNNKGFTLAELLIVVAIIAVLVAIAIPVFTGQLERSREATDAANVRSAYAEVVTHYLGEASAISMTVDARQQVSGWQTNPAPVLVYQGNGAQSEFPIPSVAQGGSWTVTIDIDTSDGSATPSIDAN